MVVERGELERRLGFQVVDDDELRDLLLTAIGRAVGTSKTRLDLPGDGSVLLTLVYDKRGKLIGIEPGSHLTEEFASRLESEVAAKLMPAPVSRVRIMGLFAAHPVTGYWRYRDRIVLRQVPDSFPQAPMLSADHPLICEITYQGSVDSSVDMSRAEREPRQLALLLTLLVRGLKLPKHHQSQKAWAYLPPFTANGPSGPPQPHSAYVQLGYNLRDVSAHSGVLTNQADLPPMPTAEEPPNYIAPELTLTLPESLTEDLDRFFQLSPNDRRRLLRSAYWLHHSREVFYHSTSAAYTALVQSVEVLLDLPDGQPKCDQCKRSMGPGPTRMFMDFISRYAPAQTANERSMHKDVYRIRSKITHGEHLFAIDEETGFMGGGQVQGWEREQLGHAQKVCRTAVIGWLRDKSAEGHLSTPA
ncbi:hypothetical protein [Streptomyces sp. KR55]|uniref:hypothetical protein n=1 Tax=Streptomyces sp. KR55 TaxID=3457425 RepID=UPI003FD5C2CF